MNNVQTLHPNEVYHIFNKAVDRNLLFRNHFDYVKFMDKMAIHLFDVVDFYAYCLLPNHFHFLVRVKSAEGIEKLNPKFIMDKGISNYISKRFSNFFNSYSKSFNIKYERKGSLFLRPFKRIAINTDSHFTQVISYIHRNPVHHHYASSINDWQYSSYQQMISKQKSFLLKDEVLAWFGGIDAYVKFQNEMIEDWVNNYEIDFEV